MKRHTMYLFAVIAAVAVLHSKPTTLSGAGIPLIKGAAFKLPVDPSFQPRLGKYHYSIQLNGLNIGGALVTIDQQGDSYKMDFDAKTNKSIDRFYKVRYSGRSIFDADHLSPVEARIWQRIKSTGKDMSIFFRDNGTIQAMEAETKKGRLVDDDVREIRTGRFTIDPFSATYLIRGINWYVGMEHILNIYNGKNQYEWKLKCEDKKLIDMAGLKREVWVIGQEYRKLDGDHQERDQEEQRGARLYVSADDSKDVLRLEISRKMGHFLASLDRFEPAARKGVERKASIPGGENVADNR